MSDYKSTSEHDRAAAVTGVQISASGGDDVLEPADCVVYHRQAHLGSSLPRCKLIDVQVYGWQGGDIAHKSKPETSASCMYSMLHCFGLQGACCDNNNCPRHS
jgi:hypothetical protein